MQKSKLISMRIDETMLSQIDYYANGYDYLSRSKVINNFLQAMLYCCASDGRGRIATCFDPYDEGYELHVINRKK